VTARASKLALPRFLLVGGLGALTNLAIFFVTVDFQGWNPTVGAVCAFVAAAAQNYLLNHRWTFAHQVGDTGVSLRGYARFMSVAVAALGINIVVLWTILFLFDPPWKVIAQAVGISAGTAVNFVGSKYWVFTSHD
jgi:putative flippase GtrA